MTTGVGSLAACAAVLGSIFFGGVPVRAQYVPIYIDPPAGIEDVWNGLNGSPQGPYDYYNAIYEWSEQFPSEWLSGSAPPDGVDVLFLDTYTGALPRQRIFVNDEPSLRSLWFEAGTWYTLYGDELTLGHHGGGTPQVDPYLLVVNSLDLQNTSEHTLDFGDFNIADATHWTGVGRIENYSEGGLGIFAGKINLNQQHIQIGGMGATHFNGPLTGGGSIIDVGLLGGKDYDQPQPHFILSADNRGWAGALRVSPRGFAIVKTDQALGYGGTKRVYHGGSLALRSHVGIPLTYNAPVHNPTHPLRITGAGIIRRAGTERIGALYNDGGINVFNMKVQFTGDTHFGARGDRQGGLFLNGRVYNTTDDGDFIKVGRGLIALNNSAAGQGANSWTGDTVIRGGVLRIGHANALPSSSNIVLKGGLLELGYEGSGAGGVHHFTRGTGPGELRWDGSGGFSAYGADRTVTIDGEWMNWTNNTIVLGDSLRLYFSSRYATHNITLTNQLHTGSGTLYLDVARGEGNAHAILTGTMKFGNSTARFTKGGPGLLDWSTAEVAISSFNASRLVRIEEGAMRVPYAYKGYYRTELSGGVLGIDQDYASVLGTGHGELNWGQNSGFAAYGGTHSVTLGSGEPFFFTTPLKFGHYTADGTVDFTNPVTRLQFGGTWLVIARGRDLSRADLLLSGGLIGGGVATYFWGDGRIDLSAANSLAGRIEIRGPELRLHSAGTFTNLKDITLSHGGTLFLDDLGTHDSDTGGAGNANRIRDDTVIKFEGGTLAHRRGTTDVENVGNLRLTSGQNTVQIFEAPQGASWSIPELRATKLDRTSTARSTLDFAVASSRLRLDTSASGHNVNNAGGDDITPWATAKLESNLFGFAQAITTSGLHYVQALAQASYHTAAQNTWSPSYNVRMTADQTLTFHRAVNSLVLGDGNLNLNGSILEIRSGGLIATGNGVRTISGASGYIETASNRPLYVHAFSDLSLTGGARLNLGSAVDLVKTQSGTLTLGSNVTHSVGNVYIHGGTLDLAGGILRVNNRITVGDGGGNATLKLAPNRWDQITAVSGLPNITLNGTPYDPRGPEYGGAQAILQMGGNTKLHLANLHIENRGTIDWVGGEVGKANILWIESLTFSGPDAQLFMRNWYEYEDILLVRKAYFNASYLQQIIFDGYQNYTTTYRQWDKDYWQITPFDHLYVKPFPEPSTYGAILGALGLTVVVWRRKRRKQTKTPPTRGAAGGACTRLLRRLRAVHSHGEQAA